MNPEQSFLSMLGLARRAGKLAFGYDAVLDLVRRHQAALLVLACDLSERSRNRFLQQVEPSGVPCLQPPFSMEQTQMAIGRRSGILALTDPGFAKQLSALFDKF